MAVPLKFRADAKHSFSQTGTSLSDTAPTFKQVGAVLVYTKDVIRTDNVTLLLSTASRLAPRTYLYDFLAIDPAEPRSLQEYAILWQALITVNERDQARLIHLVANVAKQWRNPDYEVREEAVQGTLSGETSYTEEALAFVINQTMHQLTEANLAEWLRRRRTTAPKQVGALNRGASFFLEVQDFLAVLLTGHRYYGVPNPDLPFLLPALAAEIQSLSEEVPVVFGTETGLFETSDAVIASPDEVEGASIEEASTEHGIPRESRLLRRPGYAVAVLDGGETKQELENLAEDMLLHDGHDRRNVALVWAPQGMVPDAILDAMADFRGVFPAHKNLPGTLKMQQAFLDALKIPNAYGEGMEFLLSKGEPEVQSPGHIRWTEYDDVKAVSKWLQENREHVELVVGRPSLTGRLESGVPVGDFGEAQRPSLSWQPGGVDTVAFLTRL